LEATFAVGSAHEPAHLNGIAHFLEHMMFHDPETGLSSEYQDRFAHIGASVNAQTTRDRTTYSVRVLNERFGEAMNILGEMLTGSRLSEEKFEIEKSIILEELQGQVSSYSVLEEGFLASAYGDHPATAPIAGVKDTVETFSLDDLVARDFPVTV
jgi:predicted Zn-dependent peptidase